MHAFLNYDQGLSNKWTLHNITADKDKNEGGFKPVQRWNNNSCNKHAVLSLVIKSNEEGNWTHNGEGYCLKTAIGSRNIKL